MKIFLKALVVCLMAASPAMSDTAPRPSAQRVLAAATANAKVTGRPILLLFGASWCGQCKGLNRFVRTGVMAPIFTHNYVIVNMDVMDQDHRPDQATPGGDAVLRRLVASPFPGAYPVGLPYFVVLNAQGHKIVDAAIPGVQSPGQTIGFPRTTSSITRFCQIVRMTAPHITAAQVAEISTCLYDVDARINSKTVSEGKSSGQPRASADAPNPATDHRF